MYVEEIDSIAIEVEAIDYLVDGVGPPVGEGWAILLQFGDSWPDFFVRGSKNSEDSVQLVDITIALKQRLLGYNLCENAPN